MAYTIAGVTIFIGLTFVLVVAQTIIQGEDIGFPKGKLKKVGFSSKTNKLSSKKGAIRNK